MKFKKYLAGLMVAGLAAAFSGVGSVYAAGEEDDSNSTILENIKIDGIDVSGLTMEEAIAKIEAQNSINRDTAVTLVSEYGDVETTIGELGYTADIQPAVDTAVHYGNRGSLIHRYKQKKEIEYGGAEIAVEKYVSSANISKVITDKIAGAVNGAEHASITKHEDGTVTVIPPDSVVSFDAEKTALNLAAYLMDEWNGGSITMDIVVNSSSRDNSDLASIKNLLGTYSTTYWSDEGRMMNVENAASFFDGMIVYPGQEVSCYWNIAPITEENGYHMAHVFINNEVQDGIGGGVCQFSSTLYQALLRSEIEIVRRDEHGLPVSYVPLSYDATMAGGYLDLIFCNDLDTPFYIETITEDGELTVNIWGKEYRPENRTLDFDSVVVEYLQPGPDEYIADENVPVGSEEVKSSSSTGYLCEMWKYVYVDGVLTDSIRINTSTYDATPNKIAVNPADLEAKRAGVATTTAADKDKTTEEGEEKTTENGETSTTTTEEEPSTGTTTEKPTTEAPTEKPTTEAPTEKPTTEAPTEKPTTEAPTTEEPTTEAPSTEEPTTEEPTSEEGESSTDADEFGDEPEIGE